MQDLQVFSTADWAIVGGVQAPMDDYDYEGHLVVELSAY